MVVLHEVLEFELGFGRLAMLELQVAPDDLERRVHVLEDLVGVISERAQRAQRLERLPPESFGTIRLHPARDHLVVAARLVQRQVSERPHLHAFVRIRRQERSIPREDDRLQLGAVVLEREVAVSRAGAGPLPDLTADPERLHVVLEQTLHRPVHLRYGPDLGARRFGFGRRRWRRSGDMPRRRGR